MPFIPNPDFLRELAEEPGYRDALRQQAEGVRSQVRLIAPIESGDYRDSIVVTEDEQGVYVGSTDFAAHIVEWGSANNPPYAPLRRGVTGAGLRLREEPK